MQRFLIASIICHRNEKTCLQLLPGMINSTLRRELALFIFDQNTYSFKSPNLIVSFI